MSRNDIFEYVFGMHPDFVIAECDEMFFGETLEPEDIESIKERMEKFLEEEEERELKAFDFNTASRNNTVISKDAFKDQDGKPVPLKWSHEHPEIIGPATLNVREDGISISVSEETYAKLIKND